MTVKGKFPNLTISCLEGMLRQITDLAVLALEKLPSEFRFEDWNGVSQLFEKMRKRVSDVGFQS